jgi:hypothetical protein
VHVAYVAHFPSITNASVAYVVNGFAPSNVWYCLAWCAMAGNSGWKLSERHDYALSVPGRYTIVVQQDVCYVDVRAVAVNKIGVNNPIILITLSYIHNNANLT